MRLMRFALMVAAIFATATPVFAQGYYGDYNDGLQRAIRNGNVGAYQLGWQQNFARRTRQAQRQFLGLQRRGRLGAANRSWRQSNRDLQRFQRGYQRDIRRVQRNRIGRQTRFNRRDNRFNQRNRFNRRDNRFNQRNRFNRRDNRFNQRNRFNRRDNRFNQRNRSNRRDNRFNQRNRSNRFGNRNMRNRDWTIDRNLLRRQ